MIDGLRGESFRGDIAVDDLEIKAGYCTVVPPNARGMLSNLVVVKNHVALTKTNIVSHHIYDSLHDSQIYKLLPVIKTDIFRAACITREMSGRRHYDFHT